MHADCIKNFMNHWVRASIYVALLLPGPAPPAHATLDGAECWADDLCRIAGCTVPDPDCGPQPGGGGGSTANFTIAGKVEFFAAYHSLQQVGQVPIGQAPLPYLYVCAWDADGTVDFEFTDYPRLTGTGGDDELLGCDRADAAGNYSIAASFDTAHEANPDIYLVTMLCDDDSRGAVSPADVCVRINAPENDTTYPENAKAIWSRTYSDLVPRGTKTISWNLSCPNRSGLNSGSVTCSGDLENGDWSNTCRCRNLSWKDCLIKTSACSAPNANCGDTNSRFGCNKEAVHVYRAAIQPFVSWGTNKPSSASTFGKNCDDADIIDRGSDHCEQDECQDEAKFHLSNVQAIAGTGYHGSGTNGDYACKPSLSNPQNGAGDFDIICIQTPDQPFRMVHEYGHVIQNRWLCDPTDARYLDASPHVLQAENHETREGWANYVAATAWGIAQYCEQGRGRNECYSMEAGGADNGNERSVGQFFWDLYDSVDDTGWAETEAWPFHSLRNTWSAFPNGDGPSQTRECDPGGPPGDDCSETVGARGNGVNVLDYAYRFKQEHGPLSSSFCEAMRQNDVSTHSDSLPLEPVLFPPSKAPTTLLDLCP